MAFRWIRLAALAVTLSACSNVGFDSPTRRFSGVWLHEFEGSTFVEGATAIPPQRPPYNTSDWLEFSSHQPGLRERLEDGAQVEDRDCYPVQPFLVTFVGRRTARPFGAGHMSLWRSEVTVDRMISIERLGPSFCYDG